MSIAAPQLSAELFVLPLDDQPDAYVVYAPLRRAAFVASLAVVNALADLRDGRSADIDPDLTDFLRRLEILDAGPEPSPVTPPRTGDPEPTAVTLFLTTACNLRCTYCYAAAGDTPARHMPHAVAQRGIDFVAANARRLAKPGIELTFHGGGEPTVNWRTLTAALDYARTIAAAPGESPLAVTASLATNGVLTDAQIDWIVANLDAASVSFDGLPAAHDRHRLTVAGQGSSDRVLHTLKRFDDAGFPYGVRMTVTADQIATLPDSVDFICRTLRPTRVQAEPAFRMGRGLDAPSAETDAFIAAFHRARTRARAYGHELTYSAARLGTITTHFCELSQDLFAITPDGNVSACYEAFSEQSPVADKLFYGQPAADVSAGYRFNLPVLQSLRGQTVDARPFCQGCFAKYTCAGDCYHKSLTTAGDATIAGSDRCHITRALTLDQILSKIEESGGIAWHEPASTA
ncbi:MAG TPA: radical SAM protein [Tepidisphaeraceae bacterium]|nr:radical SAM protein [Tepidisphaeraceae bacterium]